MMITGSSQICIVTGPNIDIAIKLIKRLKGLFEAKHNIIFSSKETVLELNGCTIEAFPSNHLDSYRALDNPKFILLDEADFFRKGEQVRNVSERYIAKSNPYIVMISTPNSPGGLFDKIERESEKTCMYNRIHLDYTYGLGKIYAKEGRPERVFHESMSSSKDNAPTISLSYINPVKLAHAKENEEHIFDFSNRLGAFITYMFIGSLKEKDPCNAKAIIDNAIWLCGMFEGFQELFKNKSPEEISEAFKNVYPAGNTLEKYWSDRVKLARKFKGEEKKKADWEMTIRRKP